MGGLFNRQQHVQEYTSYWDWLLPELKLIIKRFRINSSILKHKKCSRSFCEKCGEANCIPGIYIYGHFCWPCRLFTGRYTKCYCKTDYTFKVRGSNVECIIQCMLHQDAWMNPRSMYKQIHIDRYRMKQAIKYGIWAIALPLYTGIWIKILVEVPAVAVVCGTMLIISGAFTLICNSICKIEHGGFVSDKYDLMFLLLPEFVLSLYCVYMCLS